MVAALAAVTESVCNAGPTQQGKMWSLFAEKTDSGQDAVDRNLPLATLESRHALCINLAIRGA